MRTEVKKADIIRIHKTISHKSVLLMQNISSIKSCAQFQTETDNSEREKENPLAEYKLLVSH